MLKIYEKSTSDQKILALDGDFVSGDIYSFKQAALDFIEDNPNATVFIMDMEKVSFIDSAAIGVLLGFVNSYKNTGKTIKVCKMNSYVKKAISIVVSPKFLFDMQ